MFGIPKKKYTWKQNETLVKAHKNIKKVGIRVTELLFHFYLINSITSVFGEHS